MRPIPDDVAARIINKFDWIRLLESAGPASPWWQHDELCEDRCARQDKARGYTSHLSAATISHVGTVLALRADIDGTEAWLGVRRLAARAHRHKVTVIAALKHLEAKQLLYAHVRGGELGIPRSWATIYLLTRPPGLTVETFEWFGLSGPLSVEAARGAS